MDKDFLKYIRYLFFKKNMLPIYLILGVTYDCNSFCKTCFNWQELRKHKNNELSLNEIRKVLPQLGKLLIVAIGGGEPFLRQDLSEICLLLFKINDVRQITIPTNGIVTERTVGVVEDIVAKAENKSVVINLSLDGINERHDFIRGVPGNFEKLMRTYKELVLIKKRTSNLKVNLHTVLNSYNKNDIDNIIEYTKRNMTEVNFHSFELMRGDTLSKELKPLSVKEYEGLFPVLQKYWNSFNNYSPIVKTIKMQSRMVELEVMKRKTQVYPCYAGQISCVIDPIGNVWFCEMLKPLGNLRNVNYDFKRIWFSNEANDMRMSIKNKKCYCTHSCFVSSSLPFCASAYFNLAMSFYKNKVSHLKYKLMK